MFTLAAHPFRACASAISFRIYAANDFFGDNFITRFDDITLNGAVVPEPSAAVLIGGCLSTLAPKCKRRP
jgi:hypothetical protein